MHLCVHACKAHDNKDGLLWWNLWKHSSSLFRGFYRAERRDALTHLTNVLSKLPESSKTIVFTRLVKRLKKTISLALPPHWPIISDDIATKGAALAPSRGINVISYLKWKTCTRQTEATAHFTKHNRTCFEGCICGNATETQRHALDIRYKQRFRLAQHTEESAPDGPCKWWMPKLIVQTLEKGRGVKGWSKCLPNMFHSNLTVLCNTCWVAGFYYTKYPHLFFIFLICASMFTCITCTDHMHSQDNIHHF